MSLAHTIDLHLQLPDHMIRRLTSAGRLPQTSSSSAKSLTPRPLSRCFQIVRQRIASIGGIFTVTNLLAGG